MTSSPPSWKYDVILEIRLRQAMRIHLGNNRAKFHPDRIWSDFGSGRPNNWEELQEEDGDDE